MKTFVCVPYCVVKGGVCTWVCNVHVCFFFYRDGRACMFACVPPPLICANRHVQNKCVLLHYFYVFCIRCFLIVYVFVMWRDTVCTGAQHSAAKGHVASSVHSSILSP